jgi:hypothetical protein
MIFGVIITCRLVGGTNVSEGLLPPEPLKMEA